ALTNQAFTSVMPWFSYVLFVVVFMFAFSTIIGYGYYAEVALRYLFGANRAIHLTFCVVYCLTCIVGASANLANIIDFSDGLFFLLAIPNVIGLVLLRKVVRAEYERYKVTIQ
ncbi:MAG: amino acid transporter, partial [Alphaproteobacteria bacterium]|nr:amino acid transporter [Alphaproteobacteria bacterium]